MQIAADIYSPDITVTPADPAIVRLRLIGKWNGTDFEFLDEESNPTELVLSVSDWDYDESDEILFLSSPLHHYVDKGNLTLYWTIRCTKGTYQIPPGEQVTPPEGAHTVYLTYDKPINLTVVSDPNNFGSIVQDDPAQYPWVNVGIESQQVEPGYSPLDSACEWAKGEDNEDKITEKLTENLFNNFSTGTTSVKFVPCDENDPNLYWYGEIFKLSKFFSQSSPFPLHGNCEDASDYVAVMGASLGIDIPVRAFESLKAGTPANGFYEAWTNYSGYSEMILSGDGIEAKIYRPSTVPIHELPDPEHELYLTPSHHHWAQFGYKPFRHQVCFKNGLVYDPRWATDSQPPDPVNPDFYLNQRNLNQNGDIWPIPPLPSGLVLELQTIFNNIPDNPGDYIPANCVRLMGITPEQYKALWIYHDPQHGFDSHIDTLNLSPRDVILRINKSAF
jgi:hypothetical protein